MLQKKASKHRMNGQGYLSRIAIAKLHADIHMFNKKRKTKLKLHQQNTCQSIRRRIAV